MGLLARELKLGLLAMAVGVAVAVLGAAAASPAHAATTCTWGGTPAAPSGLFTIEPGVTNIPSTRPLRFEAWGTLAGGGRCHGQMRFVGQLATGATCAFSKFTGRVTGLPGVSRYVGYGGLLVPSRLYDERGRLVGVENAQILQSYTLVHSTDCGSARGYTGPAPFSSNVVLFGP